MSIVGRITSGINPTVYAGYGLEPRYRQTIEPGAPGVTLDGKEAKGGPNHIPQSFGSYLKKALDEVNALQHEADDATRAMLSGDLGDLHKAVIATEKASLAMQLTIEVRNKVIEAYQEIMRMQV